MSRRRIIMQSNGKELPSCYTRVKYLESSCKQYIEVPYRINKYTDIEIVSKFFTILRTGFFGVYESNITYELQTSYYDIKYLWMVTKDYSINDVIGHNIPLSSDFMSIKTKKSELYVDNVLITNDLKNDFINESPYNLTIFCLHNGNRTWFGKMKCKYFVISENGNSVHNLIPALDPSGRPCMYDTVTQQPFYNLGTGEFGYELLDGTYVAPI